MVIDHCCYRRHILHICSIWTRIHPIPAFGCFKAVSSGTKSAQHPTTTFVKLLAPYVSRFCTPVTHALHIYKTASTRAGVKYVLSNTNTNTNTKIWIFQIQIQIFCSTLIQIQIQIQIHRFKYKYKYKYVQPNISAETVRIQNRAILKYMLMVCCFIIFRWHLYFWKFHWH